MIRQIYTGKVLSKEMINDHIYEIWISIDLPFTFKAGQFISLFISEREARAYSLASTPRYSIDENKIRLIIGPSPEGSSRPYIEGLKVGDVVKFRGAFGIFTIDRIIPDFSQMDPSAELVFIATSTGIAPFLSMMEYLKDIKVKNNIVLYFGVRKHKDIALEDQFKDLQKELNFKYFYSVSQPDDGESETPNIHHGYVTEMILENQKPNDFYFICGSTKVVSSISAALREKTCQNVFFENYG